MVKQPETRATLQTPPGKGGIAIIALAGPAVDRILADVFRPIRSHADAGADVIRLGHLIDDGRIIDEVVVNQRENFAEINIHGGPAVARAALELLAKHGAQVALRTPADTFFTAHPMQSNPAVGREMLESLPLARSSLVVAALTQQWSGGASELARKIIECDCPPRQAASHLRQAASGFGLISKLLNPPEVVIAGPPNAGKSTLCNALIGRQVSIVDESAGTTRDWVRELALFGGVPVWLTDTAGLWQAPTPVDAEAIRRARRRAEGADLVVLIGAGEQVETPRWLHARRLLRVSAKCDACAPKGEADVIVSAHSGEGLDELKREILRSLGLLGVDVSKPMAFTARQADLLEQAARAIEANDPSAAREKLRALLGD